MTRGQSVNSREIASALDAPWTDGDNAAVSGNPPKSGRFASWALKSLPKYLAILSILLCAVLALTRPYATWEYIPAIAALAVFGTLAGRQVTRRPYPNAAPALVLALLIPGYHVIASINRERNLSTPELALDRAIPLEPAWMLAYGSIWLFAFLPVFVVRQPELTRRAMYAFITVVSVAYAGFLFYPTILPRAASTGAGFFAWTLQLNYDLDPPLNCFPSLHVAWAFVSALTCYRVHRGVGIAAQVWAALIGVSTLYTKQHYVVDVIAGMAMAYFAYAIFLRGHPREAIADIDRRMAPKRALRAVWAYALIIAIFWISYR